MGIIDLCIKHKTFQEDWEPAYEDRIYARESNHIGYVLDPEIVEKNKDIVFYCPSAAQMTELIRVGNMKDTWKIIRFQLYKMKEPDPDRLESLMFRAYVLEKYNTIWKDGRWETLNPVQAMLAILGGTIWTWT